MSPEEIAEAVADRMEGVITCTLHDPYGDVIASAKAKLGSTEVEFVAERPCIAFAVRANNVEIWRDDNRYPPRILNEFDQIKLIYQFDESRNPRLRDILRQGLQPQEAVD